jgi:ankyrin repeat protein
MHLEQLRRQAKELRDAARRGDQEALDRIERAAPGMARVSLSVAQLALARELGFPSWPRLKAAIEADGPSLRRFLDASLDGPAALARRLLRDNPRVARSPLAAAALGDARAAVSDVLGLDAERGWPPLLYACYSRWHQFEPARTPDLTDTVAALLDAGADPGTHNGRLPNRGYRSALLGAVLTDKPEVVELLLTRGAPSDDRVSVRTAAELGHHRCLELLLEHGARVDGPWTIEAAVFARDAWAVRTMLAALADRGEDVPARATSLLGEAADRGAVDVIETLLEAGADPARVDGQALLRGAVRTGAFDAAELLRSRGAAGELTVVDRLVGACMRANREQAQRLADELDKPVALLAPADLAALVDAAARPETAPVELMLDLGWPVDVRNDLGETALHSAAYEGRINTVRLLLARGAAVDARDNRFKSTPLAYATVGSRERMHDPEASGDWAATVRELLDAGAERSDVWLSGEKAPSEEAAAILRSYGVVPASETEAEPPTEGEADAGPLPEIAELVRIAYETSDLDLFGSLLAPDVRWGAGPFGCFTREEVLAEYKELIDLGFAGELIAYEAPSEDTLIIQVRYHGAPSGTRQPPPGTRVQLLRLEDDLIASIDGYDDLKSARRELRSAS